MSYTDGMETHSTAKPKINVHGMNQVAKKREKWIPPNGVTYCI